MGHIKIKPTTEIKIDFNPSELNDLLIPEESKIKSSTYLNSKKLAKDDIMMMLDDKVIFGYDYLYNNKKLILSEVNPILIFYSNSAMSFGMLKHYKEKFLTESSEVGTEGKIVNLNHSAIFFLLAVNCVINLQATLECFANDKIPKNYIYIDKTGNKIYPTVSHKLYNTLPKLKNIDFRQAKYKKHNISIDNLIKLRNNILHLKPHEQTNTGYKSIYRELLDFDFQRVITAVKTFVNFYEPNLIEECPCGINFVFEVISK